MFLRYSKKCPVLYALDGIELDYTHSWTVLGLNVQNLHCGLLMFWACLSMVESDMVKRHYLAQTIMIVFAPKNIHGRLFSIFSNSSNTSFNKPEVSQLTPIYILSISGKHGVKIEVTTYFFPKLYKHATKIDPKCNESSVIYPNFAQAFGAGTKYLQNRSDWPPFPVEPWHLFVIYRLKKYGIKCDIYATLHVEVSYLSTGNCFPWLVWWIWTLFEA